MYQFGKRPMKITYHTDIGSASPNLTGLQNTYTTVYSTLIPVSSHASTHRCKLHMSSGMVTEAEIKKQMQSTVDGDGYLLDPHTAVGVAAAKKLQKQGHTDCEYVCLATAHWAKFSEAAEGAIGRENTKKW
jgi:threonine synthase